MIEPPYLGQHGHQQMLSLPVLRGILESFLIKLFHWNFDRKFLCAYMNI
jgi:hypothetical protein